MSAIACLIKQDYADMLMEHSDWLRDKDPMYIKGYLDATSALMERLMEEFDDGKD